MFGQVQQTKNIGLVDEIGGLDAAITYAAAQAKLGNDWKLEEYPKYGTLEERILGKVPEQTKAVLNLDEQKLQLPDPLAGELQKLKAELATLKKMNDPQGVYARLPFNLKIE